MTVSGVLAGAVYAMEFTHDGVYFQGDILVEADPLGQPVSTLGVARLYWR